MQASSLQKRRVTGAHAFFLGAFLALLALTPAILPYGGRFVTRGDFIEQQLPFILETRRILRSGLNSYSFNTFLGAPAVGSYAFYTLGSVFVWPLALLPKALIPFGISVMAVLKHAVCALTSFCYLRRMVKEERLALLGSVLYKLCIQIAMSMGLPTNMMKLITAALFLLVLVLSGRKGEAIIHA